MIYPVDLVTVLVPGRDALAYDKAEDNLSSLTIEPLEGGLVRVSVESEDGKERVEVIAASVYIFAAKGAIDATINSGANEEEA